MARPPVCVCWQVRQVLEVGASCCHHEVSLLGPGWRPEEDAASGAVSPCPWRQASYVTGSAGMRPALCTLLSVVGLRLSQPLRGSSPPGAFQLVMRARLPSWVLGVSFAEVLVLLPPTSPTASGKRPEGGARMAD